MRTEPRRSDFRSNPWLIAILLLALVARLTHLATPLTPSELFQVFAGQEPFFQIPQYITVRGDHPPLFYLLLSAFSTFSGHTLWLRFVQILGGLALVYWSWRLGHYWHPRCAKIAAVLTALLPVIPGLTPGQIHPAIWLTLFGAISLYYFWRWIQTRKPEALFIHEVLLVLAIYTSYAGFGWLVLFNLVFLSTRWAYPAFFDTYRRRWWVNQGLILVLLLPWLVHIPEQWAARRFSWQWLPENLTPWLLFLGFYAVLAGLQIRSLRHTDTLPESVRLISLILAIPVFTLTHWWLPSSALAAKLSMSLCLILLIAVNWRPRHLTAGHEPPQINQDRPIGRS